MNAKEGHPISARIASRLAESNPDLASQWHPTKNGAMTPADVTAGSHRVVWWVCEHGHEWEAEVKSRAAGRGCPYCTNRRVLAGYNDLLSQNPKLAAEWNISKNGTLSPSEVTIKSGKKVWWVCERGHEWEASVSSRTDGNGCPFCSGRFPIPGETDLATTNPELAREWHPTKNGSLTPVMVKEGSAKRVWWLCRRGHEWQASIGSRASGNGCPFCGNKRVLAGFNDLSTINPSLANEWHPTKNGELRPDEVLSSCSQRVWWQCAEGHEWEATVNNRAHGYGCPYCAGQRPVQGENDLATTSPLLAKEWDEENNGGLAPSDVTGGSSKAVYWRCDKGHRWKASIASRAKGAGCPYCAGRLAIPGVTDLVTVDPRLAQEWAYDLNEGADPSTVLPNSNKKYRWRCERGHVWQATPNGRSRGTGCPVCSSEMKTSFPEQAVFWCLSEVLHEEVRNREEIPFDGKKLEIDVYLPQRRVGVEYDGIYWHKEKSEADKRKTANLNAVNIRLIRIREARKNATNGDVIEYDCYHKRDDNLTWAIEQAFVLITGQEAVSGTIDVGRDHTKIEDGYVHSQKESSLAVTHPDLAAEWNQEKNGSITPEMVTAGSSRKVWWICSKGHEWQTAICNRAGAEQSGCPFCAGQRVVEGSSDLASINPALAAEWNHHRNGDLKPTDITAVSGKKVWWTCSRGHEWEATVANRSKGQGCPYCGNKRVLAGFNDLQTTNPELASEWHPTRNGSLHPSEVLAGSSKKVWWCCKLGHEWEAKVSNRLHGCGCPICAGRSILQGFNDLTSTDPSLAAEWHPSKNVDLLPEEVGAGSGKKVWWKCFRGHEWEATISSRHKGAGCPYCAGQRAIRGETDLETTNPALAAEWHPSRNGSLYPHDVMVGTSKKVWWLCPECGNEWMSTVYDRSSGNGCPRCHHRLPKASSSQ